MRAVDTNVLVRLITRDNPRQLRAAEALIERGAWISILALTETMWVLSAAYQRSPGELAIAVEMLLNHKNLVVQDADIVAAALALFRNRPSLGFSDCVVLQVAKRAGHLPLGTFDRGLAKVEGTQKL